MADGSVQVKFSPLQIFVGICMFLGLVGFMIFLTDEVGFDELIIFSWFFALVGGLTYVALVRTTKMLWRVLTAGSWVIALFMFTIFIIEEIGLHEGLALGMFFPAIGMLIYGLFSHQSPLAQHKQPAPPQQLNSQNQFDPLGQPRYEDMTPAERDRAASRR